MNHKCGRCKLSAISLGVAFAAVSALTVLGLGVLQMHYGMGEKMIELFATIYKGYAATWDGIRLGAGYAAVVGFTAGLIFGWVYNICASICNKCCKGCKCSSGCAGCKNCKTETSEKSA